MFTVLYRTYVCASMRRDLINYLSIQNPITKLFGLPGYQIGNSGSKLQIL